MRSSTTRAKRLARTPNPTCETACVFVHGKLRQLTSLTQREASPTRERARKGSDARSCVSPAGSRNLSSGSPTHTTLSAVFWTRPNADWTKRSFDAMQYCARGSSEGEEGVSAALDGRAREGQATHDAVDALGLELVVLGHVRRDVVLWVRERRGGKGVSGSRPPGVTAAASSSGRRRRKMSSQRRTRAGLGERCRASRARGQP